MPVDFAGQVNSAAPPSYGKQRWRGLAVVLKPSAALLLFMVWFRPPGGSPWVDAVLLWGGMTLSALSMGLRRSRQVDPLALVTVLFAAGGLAYPREASTGPRAPLAHIVADQPLAISLPGGTVELAGISVDWYGAMSPVWWHADGSSYRVRNWAMDPRYIPTVVDERQQRLVALRATSQTDPASILDVRFDGDSDAYRAFQITSAETADTWRGLARIFPRQQVSTTIQVQVAVGPFDPLAVEWHLNAGTGIATREDLRLVFRAEPHESGMAITFLKDGASARPQFELQVRVKGADEQWRTGRRGDAAPDTASAFYLFEAIDLDEVEAVSIHVRRVYGIEFQNVALNQSRRTVPQAIVISPVLEQ